MPAPLPPPRPEKPPTSFVPLLLAGLLALMVFVALFFLTLGLIGPVVVVGLAIFGFGLLQYVLWGWWVSGILRNEETDDKSDNNKEV